MLRNVLRASGSVTLASGALQIGLLLLLLLNVLNTKYVWSTCQGHSWSDRTYFGPISQTACSSSSLFRRFWMATWPLTVTFCTSLDVCYFESNCTVSWIVILCTQPQLVVVVFHLHCWRLETAERRTSSLQLFLSLAVVTQSANVFPVQSFVSCLHRLLGLPLPLAPSRWPSKIRMQRWFYALIMYSKCCNFRFFTVATSSLSVPISFNTDSLVPSNWFVAYIHNMSSQKLSACQCHFLWKSMICCRTMRLAMLVSSAAWFLSGWRECSPSTWLSVIVMLILLLPGVPISLCCRLLIRL